MYNILDEVLAGAERFRIKDEAGNTLYDDVQIEQKTPTVQVPTPLNKATLEGMQAYLLEATKEVVAEYTSTQDLAEIEITDLDLADDGNLYEINVSGKVVSRSYGLGLVFNNIREGYRTRGSGSSTSTSTDMRLTITDDGGIATVYLAKVNGYIVATCFSMYRNGSDINWTSSGSMLALSDNLTSIKVVPTNSGTQVASGTSIKISKRRA